MNLLKTTLFASLLSFSLVAQAAEKNSNSGSSSAQETSRTFTAVAKKAIPAVVFIKAEGVLPEQNPYGQQGEGPSPYDNFGDDFLQRFFGLPRGGRAPRQQPQVSQGSGFIVTSNGYVMTNAHVVKGADKITVVLNDSQELPASLIGADPHTDIAVLKIEGKDFPYLNFGNSDATEIGEWVIAIGSPFQLEASLTVGVISAKGRQNLKITDLENYIQTDAAINPGNSGGPLLDLNGDVIGINSAIATRSGGYMGIGFAIPSNMVVQIKDQIIEQGMVIRGHIGIALQPIDKEIAEAFNLDKIEGALVSEVFKDSPAEKGGLKQGDIIIELNGVPVKTVGAFRTEVAFMKPGSTITLKVNRKGEILSLPITIGKATDELVASNGAVVQLGIEAQNLNPQIAAQLGYGASEEGVVITHIKPGSIAAQAGLRPGFLILAINHKKIKNLDDFNSAINELGKQKRILLLAKQGNVTRYYSIKID